MLVPPKCAVEDTELRMCSGVDAARNAGDADACDCPENWCGLWLIVGLWPKVRARCTSFKSHFHDVGPRQLATLTHLRESALLILAVAGQRRHSNFVQLLFTHPYSFVAHTAARPPGAQKLTASSYAKQQCSEDKQQCSEADDI